jgi:hypothetical protein
MTLLTGVDILSADDIQTKVVDVPEFGEGAQVKVKSLTLQEQLDYEKEIQGKKDLGDPIFSIVTKCCVDENNKPLFTKDDVAALKLKSSKGMLKIFTACLEINSLDIGSVEKLAKNS